jgi:phenylalanyl-tRNA synthetase beta chain
LRLIQDTAGPELKQIALFDVFEDAVKMGMGKKSLAFRLLFQALDHTLTDAFIQERMQMICDRAARELDAILRDGAPS